MIHGMSFESIAAVKMCPHGGHTLTFRTGRAKYITHAVGVDITAAQPRYNFSRSEKYNLSGKDVTCVAKILQKLGL